MKRTGLRFHRVTYHAGMHTGTAWTAVIGGVPIGRWDRHTLGGSWVETADGRAVHVYLRDWRAACWAEATARAAVDAA